MKIQIQNQQKRIPLIPAQIHTIAKKVLTREGVRKAELSIVFVTDATMRDLNRRFHQRDYPTDVLAFDLTEFITPLNPPLSGGRGLTKKINGEIIISTTTAYRQAKQFQTTAYQEIILYLIHGILHLLGYDDHSIVEKKRMRRKENELMTLMKSYWEKNP